jgi:hypothetical protein
MIYVDRSVLKDISKDLQDLTNEASQLLQYHHLIVAAFTDENKYPPDIQVDNYLFLLDLFLKEWDRERLEQFVENLNQTHTKVREILG